jgi:lysozyme
MNQLIAQLKRHEGLRLKPYKCTADKWTIGYGRNIQDNGISVEEAEMLLRHDILTTTNLLLKSFPWMSGLNDARISALINFTFNVGIGTVKTFSKSLAALQLGNYDEAANEMMNSKWAKQVGSRSLEITDQIRSGKWSTSVFY